MISRTLRLGCLVGALILSSAVSESSFGQAVTTAFTFQGVLKNSGAPLNGTVDLRFTLWDAAAGGSQVGGALAVNAASLTDGLLTTTLDFGVNAFGGSQRFLQIEVDSTPGGGAGPFVTLTPRQPLTAVPYAMFALAGSGQWTPAVNSSVNYTAGNVSVGTTSQFGKVTIYPSTGGGTQTGLYVRNTDGGNQTIAGQFVVDSPNGQAVLAQVNGTNGSGRAVSAITTATQGEAVYGFANSATGSAMAIHGESNSASGWAGYFDGRTYHNGTALFASTTLVGRTTTIGSEIFGIRHPATSGYGGMYVDTAGATAQPFYGYATGGVARMWTYYSGSTDKWTVYNGADRLTIDGAGNVGIGTTSPGFKLQIVGGTDSEPGSGGFIVTGDTASTNLSIDNNEIMARNNGAPAVLSLNNDGGDVSISAAGTGKLICKVLQITGGADFSEQFQVNDAAQLKPEPGMVVVIDPENPGQLVPATSAYDRKVAGVISGAGGVKPGMMMSQHGTIADGEQPIALTGRVYCLVDATDSAIEPGDMLTTSNTAGHAMKAMDTERSHGAIIGKAMTALPRGEKGLVLVLVNLQ